MEIRFKGKFLSITDFEWKNIPALSIITGMNGVGKTQLIRLLHTYFSENHDRKNGELICEGFTCTSYEAGHWGMSGPGFDYHDQTSYRFFKQCAEDLLDYVRERKTEKFLQRMLLEEDLTDRERFFNSLINQILEKNQNMSDTDIKVSDVWIHANVHFFYKNWESRHHQNDSLSVYFLLYRIKEWIAKRSSHTASDLGEPPWEVLNKVLKSADFPYRVAAPPYIPIPVLPMDEKGFNFEYKLQFISEADGSVMETPSFSSGEYMLSSLALSIYFFQEIQTTRKILFMDEPTSHLHPSLIEKFYNVIYTVFVKEYGIRVIMATHSPSAVALAPEADDVGIFEMRKNPTTLRKIENRNEIISKLGEGLVVVNKSSRFILTEGKDDPEFYQAVFRIVEQSKECKIELPLVFIPGTSRDSVKHFLLHFPKAVPYGSFRGVIDGDNNPVKSLPDGLHQLERYSIENYLIDPIIIFAQLLSYKQPIKVPGIHIEAGEENLFQRLPSEKLQAIVDAVFENLSAEYGISNYQDCSRIEVRFSAGIKLQYPEELFVGRGKDILARLNQRFSKAGLHNARLIQMMRRIHILPLELHNLIETLSSKD